MPDPLWQVHRAQQVIPGILEVTDTPVLYGETFFCDLWAEALGIILLDPLPNWLTHLPQECLKRTVRAGRFNDGSIRRDHVAQARSKPQEVREIGNAPVP